MTKIMLLLLIPKLPAYEVYLLITILTIGSVSSHLSRKIRHRLWWVLPNTVQDQRRG